MNIAYEIKYRSFLISNIDDFQPACQSLRKFLPVFLVLFLAIAGGICFVLPVPIPILKVVDLSVNVGRHTVYEPVNLPLRYNTGSIRLPTFQYQ